MTRETKIGLLVGLAFVLVVGILLSEHLTSATERPAAELALAGKSVRQGVSAPGADQNNEPALPPSQPVPIARDLSGQVTAPAPIPQVTITTPAQPIPAAPTQTIIVQAPAAAPLAPAQLPAQLVAPIAGNTQPTAPVVTQLPQTAALTDPFANDPANQLARLAQQHGEPLDPVDPKAAQKLDPKGGDVTPATPQIPADHGSTTVATTKTYKAQPGDTLNKLAAKLPGGSTKATRDAIVAINPTLQKDPNKIIAGRSYLLPFDLKTVAQLPAAQSPAGQSTPVIPDAKIDTKPMTPTVVAKADSKSDAKSEFKSDGRFYVVKPGDTLSKIAMIELGSKSHVDELKKLNEDKLKGGDKITVDMKLKLPAANPTA